MIFINQALQRFLFGMILCALFCLTLTAPSPATVSTNVPLDDVSYLYVEKLIAQGLVKSDVWATRPFSRFEMARLIAEARKNWAKLSQAERAELALIGNLLEWLEKRFQEEIEDLTGAKKAARTFFKPADRASVLYRYQDGSYSVFNKQGLDFYDGNNFEADLTMRSRLANCVGLFLQPRFVYYGEEGAKNEKGEEVDQTKFDFLTYYAKLDLYNIELELGADSLWWNPAHSGSLLMSDNAEPFPMIKLSNPIPTVLPWNLGLFKYNLVFGILDSDRLNPLYPDAYIIENYNEPYFAGIHVDFKPRPWLEFGFNLISIYGGEGVDLSFADHFRAIFTNANLTGNVSANSQFSMFWNFRFNDIWRVARTLSFYGEWGGEDMALPPDRRAYQLGLRLGDFLKWKGRLQLTLEYTSTSPESVPTAWYTNSEYPATYEGKVFGHHVGTDGEDFYGSLCILVNPKLQILIDGSYERRRTTLENGERSLLGRVGATYFLSEKMILTGSVGLENVDNVDYVEGATDNRSFVSFQLRYYF